MAAGDNDEGFSLMELVITLSIMSVVTLMLVSATVEIYSGTKAIDNTAEARDQLDNSFRRLDRELRYARWIGQVKTAPYRFRYELPKAADGKSQCRELSLAADGVLSLAAWKDPDATGPTSRPAIASGVTQISGVAPFAVYYAGAAPASAGMGSSYVNDFVQTRLQFTVKVGKVTLPFDSIYTAQNNTDRATAVSESDCKEL
ncbi:prepilin-type N-terminal cleavage/methylation domain-containing protein [Actinoplanes sp. NPDC051861]|uniref:PulJ/GspJ family protein n=1 Tax=Actinoplanes sp. NPDC051861 TaxID=3155170 RepID=UPI003418A94E